MTRGFVTIATGEKRYYEIAANLLASYRHFSANPMPFALICDAENSYTESFDKVVLLDNPQYSFLDKLALTQYAPFDETIFIDADCLAYRDLNDLWDLFEGKAPFSVLGVSYPTDYRNAWFKKENVGEYGDRIQFIPDFIGAVYYIRKSEELAAFDETCDHIYKNYQCYTFRQYDKPVDEPIFALAIAVHGFEPADRTKAPVCFYPHATYFDSDIRQGRVNYIDKWDRSQTEQTWAYMVHWGNIYTTKPPYTIEVARLKRILKEKGRIATACTIARITAIRKTKDAVKRVLSAIHLLDAGHKAYNAVEQRKRIRRRKKLAKR